MISLKEANAHLAPLIGMRMQQLALGMYEFQLNFDGNMSISVEKSVLIEKTGSVSFVVEADNPSQSKELSFLLGCIVVDAQISETRTLKIVFDDQSKITVPASDDGHDAYVVWIKGDPLPG